MDKSETKASQKKESKLSIDKDYDFIFIKNWSPVLRWIALIPFGIISIFLVQFTFGFIVNKIESSFNSTTLTVIMDCILLFFKYMISLIVVVAVAPVKREKKFNTGIILSIFPIAICILAVLAQLKINENVDSEYYYTTSQIAGTIIAGILGVAYGLYSVKRDLSKNIEENIVE